MNILGLNFNHADASAALIVEDKIIAAVEEERFTRIKHYSGFPENSINYCLQKAKLSLSDIDIITLNYNSNSNFKFKLNYAFKNLFKLSTIKKIINYTKKANLDENLKKFCKKYNFKGKILNIDHHLSHLSSSLTLSKRPSGIGLTIDGFGDFCSMQSFFICNKENKITTIKKVLYPHSLGIFYQSLTQFLGFKNYGDEYKVMGLASYGKPNLLNEFNKIIQYDEKNYFKLDLKYFAHDKNPNFKYFFPDGTPVFPNLYSNKLKTLFGAPRLPCEEINDHHMNIAASMQKTFENIVIKILKQLYMKYNCENLYLAGGCALNSKLNGLIKKETQFKNIYIQPNAGDGGGSLGSAVNFYYNKKKTLPNTKSHVFLGPDFSNDIIESILNNRKDIKKFQVKKISDDDIYKQTALKIYENKVVGWFKGRMEWGPRALGNRSILANPNNKNIKDILNLKIKLREKFRPFAPAVLIEDCEQYFDLDYQSPFMLNVVEAKRQAKESIPSTVHVDNTCRVQTVSFEDNQHFYNLIKAFKDISGIPVILNTSFNENEPIVLSPENAVDCFVRTQMDYLVLENWTISR